MAEAGTALFRLDPLAVDLVIDPSTKPLLPRGDPAQEIYRSAVLDFGDDEVFMIAVECDDVFTRSCLEAIKGIGDRVARLSGVRSVTSLVDVTSFRWVAQEGWVEVRPFIGEIPGDPLALEELRRRALADPVYRRTLVSKDAKAAAINVSFRDMSAAEFIASGLDDTVHYLVRYRCEREAGAAPEEAVRRCMARIGRPIAITSVMISAGFLVVAFSEFATLRQFGVLSAVTMGLSLVTDLLLLPALLMRARI